MRKMAFFGLVQSNRRNTFENKAFLEKLISMFISFSLFSFTKVSQPIEYLSFMAALKFNFIIYLFVNQKYLEELFDHAG